MQWTADGNAYYSFSAKGIDIVDLLHPDQNKPFLTTQELIPKDSAQALEVQSFQVSPDGNSLLLFANTQRVWRDNTRGDYWIFDKKPKSLFNSVKDCRYPL